MSVNVFDVPEIHIGGVACESLEAGHAHLYEFATRKGMGSYNYAFLMLEEGGSYKLVERPRMPCWGAIREYNCGTRPDDPWPGDLRAPKHIFPKTGNPVAISFQFCAIFNMSWNELGGKDGWNRFLTEFVFNTDVSPWASILKDYELTIINELITGVVFKDTNIDPTVMANLMKFAGNPGYYFSKKWNEWVDKGYHPLTSYLMCVRGSWPRIVPERYFNQNPFDYTGGTFYDRYSYNRPDVEKIFGGKNNEGVIINNLSIDQLEALRLSVMGEELKEAV